MGVAALILLILAVLAGTALLAELGPGLRERRPLVAVVSTHVVVATASVVVWLVAMVTSNAALGWLAAGGLVVVAALGTTALVRSRALAASSPAVVVVHGTMALAALVLAFAAAASHAV